MSSDCFENKEIETIPVKSKKKKPKERFLNYIVFIDSKQKTIVNKRTNKDIWYKLNEFPLIESKTEIQNIKTLTDFKKIIDNSSLTIIKEKEKIYRVKHILSHQILYISFFKYHLLKLPKFL